MVNSEEHDTRVIRLLRKDADRRNYIRKYMKEYRANKKEVTGIGQKQYYSPDDIKKIQRASYKLKTVINDIKFFVQRIKNIDFNFLKSIFLLFIFKKIGDT